MKIVRQEVVATALALLDEVGVEGLTMRKLADALKVQAPSLYWHFASKEALLEGMADALMRDVAPDDIAEEPWDARLRRIASDIRLALLSRRDAARVFAGTYPVTDNVLRVGSLLIDCLKRAGADDRTASWGAFTLSAFVIGFVIEEQALAGRADSTGNPPAAFPLAAIAMREITAANASERFAFGVELQVGALRRVVSE